jgi:hypothetical protein
MEKINLMHGCITIMYRLLVDTVRISESETKEQKKTGRPGK